MILLSIKSSKSACRLRFSCLITRWRPFCFGSWSCTDSFHANGWPSAFWEFPSAFISRCSLWKYLAIIDGYKACRPPVSFCLWFCLTLGVMMPLFIKRVWPSHGACFFSWSCFSSGWTRFFVSHVIKVQNFHRRKNQSRKRKRTKLSNCLPICFWVFQPYFYLISS